jgi:Ca-activated chloride channel family protein
MEPGCVSWARPEHRPRLLRHPNVVVLAIAMILAVFGSSFAQEAPLFRAGVDVVNLEVTVADKQGHAVTGLTASEFAIVEDGTPQTVRYFAAAPTTGARGRLHLGLVMDVSDSMAEPLRFTKTAAIRFLTTLVEAVDVTVVDFDTEVRAARYEQDQYVRLIERIRQRKASGGTALYDAVGLYVADAAEQEGRKVMLLYTDGGDNQSSMDFADLLEVLKASDVTIYVIGPVPLQATESRDVVVRQLTRIAEITGGEAFFPQSTEDLARAYEAVIAEIRAGYTLGYVPTNDSTDGAWRRVDVNVIAKDGRAYRVRERHGYYAPHKAAASPCGTGRPGERATPLPSC